MTTLHADRIVQEIIRRKPMHRKFLLSSIERLSDDERLEAEKYIEFLFAEKVGVEDLVEAYLTIVEDTFIEEAHFRETGRYRHSSYDELADIVYHNPKYMRRYMLGLALTSYWWGNHLALKRFFHEVFPTDAGGKYLEVGPGHGIYFVSALRSGNFDEYEGIDISETSVALTERMIASGYFGSFPKAKVTLGDFLLMQRDRPADALVMGEVLEHVENPERFLAKAYDATGEQPFVFLTTCINSPAIDHIYNPETFDNLAALVGRTKFVIREKLLVPRMGKTLEECEKERLPVNVGLVLGK